MPPPTMFLSNPLRSILSSIVVTISLLAIIPSPAYSNILPIRSQFVRSPGSSLHGCREDGDFPDLRKATPTLSGVTIDNAQDSFVGVSFHILSLFYWSQEHQYSVGIVIAGQVGDHSTILVTCLTLVCRYRGSAWHWLDRLMGLHSVLNPASQQ